MSERNVPEVRFKGFCGEWEEKILEAISRNTYGGGTPNTSINEFWSGNTPWIQSSDLVEHDVRSILVRKRISNLAVNKSATKIVPTDSIAVVTRVGVGKLAVIPFQYSTSQDFLSLSNLTAYKWFVAYSLYRKLQNELHQVQGTSIKGITKDELLKKSLFVSKSTIEQTKIGEFFKNLDNLIAQNQKKYDKLVNMKKACLDKMFPKDGADTPEVRFKGFGENWELCKIKDICSISTGKSNTQDKTENGKYPFYVRSSIIEQSNRYLFDEEAVLTVGDGVGTGKVFHYVNGKYDLHQRVYKMFDFDEGIIAKYFYYYFSIFFYKRVMSMTAKTSVDSVRLEMISEMDFIYPSKEEQQKLLDYLDNLDNLITLRKTELEKLKNIKKACLDKMFL